jgi:hypothetical protein
MILGFLGGLVIGCLIAMLNARFWHSVGPTKDLIVRINVYVGTPLIVIGSAITGALFGMVLGW